MGVNAFLAVAGADDAGLTAAAAAYVARAPYIWRMNGEKLSAIAQAVGGGAELVGVTYQRGKAGVHRAFLRGNIAQAALDAALAKPELASVHQLVVRDGPTATNPKPEASTPATPSGAPTPAVDAPAAGGAAVNGRAGKARSSDALHQSWTLRCSRRIPVPGSSNAHLFVPAGAAGVAMANLAARMGLETTGITLPVASPADAAVASRRARSRRSRRRVSARAGGREEAAGQRYRRRAVRDRPRPRGRRVAHR
ncbi:MAG: hypothetical protein WDO73_00795 [Ignavibacteriota bacterium]